MKDLFLPLMLIGLVFAVPALSQGADKEEDLAKTVKELQKKVDEQAKRIEKLEERAEADKKASEALAKKLKKARKDGFTYPAPNPSAKEALLGGLEAYAGR